MFCDDNKTKTYEATGQSSSIAGNKTKKSSDESPTDQKHRLGDRADQAYRFQLIVRSISFGCLTFGGAYCSIFPFLVVFETKTSLVVPPQSFTSKYCILVIAVEND